MARNIYCDPTTGEYVGEYEYRDGEHADVTRRSTEWFGSEREALEFSRTGKRKDTRE